MQDILVQYNISSCTRVCKARNKLHFILAPVVRQESTTRLEKTLPWEYTQKRQETESTCDILSRAWHACDQWTVEIMSEPSNTSQARARQFIKLFVLQTSKTQTISYFQPVD